MSNIRQITVKNLLYQVFVQNLIEILKTFHFVQKCTHLECQWNVLCFPPYIPNIWLPWNLEFLGIFPPK